MAVYFGTKLRGRFGYFLFFLLGEGEGESDAPGGDRFLIETPRRGGGCSPRGEGLGWCLWRIGEFGGRAKFCFGGRNVHQGTSDFQSEVGEVFGEIGGELPAKFGRRFQASFAGKIVRSIFPPKLHRKFHHQTSLRGSGLWRALKFLRFARLASPNL